MAAWFRGSEHREKSGERPPRQSSGWRDVLAFLRENDGQRVLDFGATSPANINLLTGLGHSVYMADVVADAAKPEWQRPVGDGGKVQFDAEEFLRTNLSFEGREFDVLLLWDAVDYLPPELAGPLFGRLRDVLRPGGRLLAFFHGNATGPETAFSRYQLTDTPELKVIPVGKYPLQAVYAVRQVEKFLEGYADQRFFLAKDNVREVIATR